MFGCPLFLYVTHVPVFLLERERERERSKRLFFGRFESSCLWKLGGIVGLVVGQGGEVRIGMGRI